MEGLGVDPATKKLCILSVHHEDKTVQIETQADLKILCATNCLNYFAIGF
jgi:hypothetical protein